MKDDYTKRTESPKRNLTPHWPDCRTPFNEYVFNIPELLAPEVSPSNEFGGSSLTCIKGSPDWGNKGLLSSSPSSLSSLEIKEWWIHNQRWPSKIF